MDQEQLKEAILERKEVEYLLNGQWVSAEFREPTNVSLIGDTSSQNITIQLSKHPRDNDGIIHLNEDDIEHRLRLKGPN
jgi:hypothetical protein